MSAWEKKDLPKTIGDGIGRVCNHSTLLSARCILSYLIEKSMRVWSIAKTDRR